MANFLSLKFRGGTYKSWEKADHTHLQALPTYIARQTRVGRWKPVFQEHVWKRSLNYIFKNFENYFI
jgi:hypothetical protein